MTEALDASSKSQETLPVSSDQLLLRLKDWDIAFSYYEHAPLKTVADAKHIQDNILPAASQGGYTKNLYLRDKRKQNLLVVVDQDRNVDLKVLSTELQTAALSFGSPDRLMENLGVRPGAVSPLAMINGAKTGVRLCIERGLRECPAIYMHPLVNDRTLGLSADALSQFVDRLESQLTWFDLP